MYLLLFVSKAYLLILWINQLLCVSRLGLTVIQYSTSIPWPSCPLNISATVFQTARQIEISSLLRVHIFVSVPEFLPPYFFFSRAFPEWPCCCISTAVPYWIIMISKTPEKFEKLLLNDYWLLVPWRFYARHPHHTSRDRSRFLRMILFINNTKNTFYETKGFKDKTRIIFEIYL